MGDTLPSPKPDETTRPIRKVEKLDRGWVRLTVGDRVSHIPPAPPRLVEERKP